MRRHLRDDGAFHRADVGKNGALFQMRREASRDVAARADRRAHDDEIGSTNRLRIILCRNVGEAEFAGAADDLLR